eukprot:CAMPEP_0114614732 /NCGR_PEP_ID=MMETSP0168-20121206/5804_1 /TAXON_ID=95228 ORGANISM="Vannella sp., Strain DIVA3 517/6/12" /NCGR_SAMPLE_ID=MMETSP0168 /ASSEMBLY_ACC=CAM_ASM_000044 /LENGTH=914 /DNA_ID=CAMNT_0001825787 /DNA_START=60 /DNA_END=2800 /DNA_ORIENTATION=+
MGAQHSHLIYRPPAPPSYDETLDGLIRIPGGDGDTTVPTVFLPYKNKDGSPALYTILHIGGNASDLGTRLSWLKTLNLTLRVNVCSFEYPSFGLYGGEPSEKGCYAAAAATYDHLVQERDIDPSHIILMGKDLGAAVAVWLLHDSAAGGSRIGKRRPKRSASGVILQSPFTSLLGVAGSKVPMFKADMFDSAKRIAAVSCPVYIAHGEKDELVDIKLAKKLSTKVGKDLLWRMRELADVDHLLEFQDDFLDDMIEFIEHVGKGDPEYKAVVVAPKPVPVQFTSAPSHVMTEWLRALGMEHYVNSFLGAGFFSLDTLLGVDKVDLMGVGIESDEDMEVLLKAIRLHFNPDAEREEAEGARRGRRPSVFSGSFVEEEVDIELPLADFLGPNSEPDVDIFLSTMLEAGAISQPKKRTVNAAGEEVVDGEVINAEEVKKALKFAASFLTPTPEVDDDDIPVDGLGISSQKVKGDPTTRIVTAAGCPVARFAHNAFARCQLRHRNVVQARSVCIAKGKQNAILVEDCPYTLAEYLQEKGSSLSTMERLNLAIGIADGLQFLHSRDPVLLHKRLSTSTVFVTEKGVAKLGRFLVGASAELETLAPEALRFGTYSCQSDVYSYGLILYELFSEKKPFDCHPCVAATKAGMAGHRPSTKDLPASMAKIISMCWNSQAPHRPSMPVVIKLLVAVADAVKVESKHPALEPTNVPKGRLYAFPFLATVKDHNLERDPAATLEENCAASLAAHMLAMLDSGLFVDMLFKVGEEQEQFSAHKAVVAARSLLFSGLLQASTSPVPIVELPKVPPAIFPRLLRYLYSGHLEVDEKNVLDLMLHAQALQLREAVDCCVQFLEMNGLPEEVSEKKEDQSKGAASVQSQARMKDVKASLRSVESGIKNIEETLSTLNRKLEKVSARRNQSPA